MKRFILTALGLTALLAVAGSCAKKDTTGMNDLNKLYFDAWLATHYPDAARAGHGIYILEDKVGSGELVGDEDKSPYVYATCTITDLEGNVTSTDSEIIAQQLGTYNMTDYYGPGVVGRIKGDSYAGINDMLSTMRVGGTRKAVIPGWLMSKEVYDDEQGYLDNGSGTDAIYTVTVEEVFTDVAQWELDSLESYMKHNYPDVDTVVTGFYYIQTKEPLDTTMFNSDATVYLNYTGRLLNGQVFDTTIEDTAKVHHKYSPSTTYEPTYVKWNSEDYTQIVMGENSSEVTSGFSRLISMMRAGEKGFAVFHSAFGYSSSGSGSAIPAFSPLIFEIELLGLNKDGSIDPAE